MCVATFSLSTIIVCGVAALFFPKCDLDYNANTFNMIPGFFFVHTYGDSITDAGTYGNVMDYSERFNLYTNNYQRHFYQYLHARNVETSVLNFGVGGQLTDQIVSRYLAISTITPRNTTLIFMSGTNNVLGYVLTHGYLNATYITDTIIHEYKKMLYTANERGHRVIICSIPPMSKNTILTHTDIADGIVEINARLSEFAQEMFCDTHKELVEHPQNLYYIKGISMDGIHLYARGNRILGQTIAQCILNKVS